ncbi:hypothetical protein LMH73_027805 [Vibrio splendidus]|nr:hypothetical protein [Vibrio splendidus]MCC4882762.1 hypothetical protein [Vibrio splendidus]
MENKPSFAGLATALAEHLTKEIGDIASFHFHTLSGDNGANRIDINCFIKPLDDNQDGIAAFNALLPSDSDGCNKTNNALGITLTCFVKHGSNGLSFDSVFIDRFTHAVFLRTRRRNIHVNESEYSSDLNAIKFKTITSKTKSYVKAVIKETINSYNEQNKSRNSIDTVLGMSADLAGVCLRRVGKNELIVKSEVHSGMAVISPAPLSQDLYNINLSNVSLSEDKLKKLYDIISS